MTRVRRFESGETDHIVQVDGTWECSVCKERYRKRRERFHLHKWKRKHVGCVQQPDGPVVECPVPEARGIDDQMPKTPEGTK